MKIMIRLVNSFKMTPTLSDSLTPFKGTFRDWCRRCHKGLDFHVKGRSQISWRLHLFPWLLSLRRKVSGIFKVKWPLFKRKVPGIRDIIRRYTYFHLSCERFCISGRDFLHITVSRMYQSCVVGDVHQSGDTRTTHTTAVVVAHSRLLYRSLSIRIPFTHTDYWHVRKVTRVTTSTDE